MKPFLLAVSILLLSLSLSPLSAQELPKNYDPDLFGFRALAVIPVVDSGWTTNTSTSDCATGWGDDTWSLQLSAVRALTVTVNDCCCPGDYFEVYVDDRLIGTTPVSSGWGCGNPGSNSSGSFTVTLCPGTHTIKVRDAGFDGHSLEEIQRFNMCPAGFTVSGALGPASASVPNIVETAGRAAFTSRTFDAETADQLEALLAQVEPFVYIDDQGMQRIRMQDARDAGVSGEALGLGHRMIALNNRILHAAQRDEQLDLTPADYAFIEPLFLKQALSQTDPCGTRQSPAPCPPWVESRQYFNTEQEARNHLLAQGFHQTVGYATGGPAGRDFTRVVAGHPCGGSSFRTHAIIRRDGQCWTYSTQTPEPNPEVLGYIWPRFNWVGYVRWWHAVHC
jgi:hypothetical protein